MALIEFVDGRYGKDSRLFIDRMEVAEIIRPEEFKTHFAARAPEQGGEMREALKDWLKFSDDVIPSCAAGDDWLGSLRERTRALLARESAEPTEEPCPVCGGARWTMEAVPAPPDGHPEPMQFPCEECGGTGTKPADDRRPEADALIWMTERLMGSSAASTMRGWLAEYRATGKLVVRDADGTVKESLTVGEDRGPDVGDVVYIHWRNDHREVTTYSALLQAEIRGAHVVVLMRRADAEARIGGKA